MLESISTHDFKQLTNLRPAEADPPDCVAETAEGTKVGFEVRELVDQEAVQLNEKGEQVYRDWRPPEVVQEIQNIINEKDEKKFLGGPYEKLVLVIHTAEPVLTFDELKPVLYAHAFEATVNLTDVFLLSQYEPATKGYPYIKIKIAANNKMKADD